MKKLSFAKILCGIVILGLFSFSACKKDGGSSSSGYYVKFKLDGTDKQYSQTTAAVFSTIQSVYSCAMVGEQQNGTVYEGMGISLFDDVAIAANVTYTDEEVASLGTPHATLLYTDATGAQSTSGFGAAPNVKVVITSMDDKTVTGTFSGTLTSATDLTTTQTVTDGTFHLPRN